MHASDDELRRLERRRDELRERLAAIRRDYGRGLEPDFAEQAVELENAEVLAEIARVSAEELERVERRIVALKGDTPRA